jgi:hypothetical protein
MGILKRKIPDWLRCAVRWTSKYAELEVRHFGAFAVLCHRLNLQLSARTDAGPKDSNSHGPDSIAISYSTTNFLFFSVVLRPNACHGLLILEVSRSYTTTHHSRKDSSGRVISSLQRPLPENTQHSQQTNIHAPSGIRTHDLSRRAPADLPLRPRGHWDRHSKTN